jgi:hypothetical protein
MKIIKITFPKTWCLEVNILGLSVRFTEKDVLKISNSNSKINILKTPEPHTYLITGPNLENIFSGEFLEEIRETGLVIKKIK